MTDSQAWKVIYATIVKAPLFIYATIVKAPLLVEHFVRLLEWPSVCMCVCVCVCVCPGHIT